MWRWCCTNMCAKSVGLNVFYVCTDYDSPSPGYLRVEILQVPAGPRHESCTLQFEPDIHTYDNVMPQIPNLASLHVSQKHHCLRCVCAVGRYQTSTAATAASVPASAPWTTLVVKTGATRASIQALPASMMTTPQPFRTSRLPVWTSLSRMVIAMTKTTSRNAVRRVGR